MRWQSGRRSENVEDRRGVSPRGLAIGGGGLGTLAVIVLYLLLGGNPSNLLGPGALPGGSSPSPTFTAREQELADFVSVVLADTEDVWTEIFRSAGRTYEVPTLVLFNGQVDSACGLASAAVGPFYCPADRKLYIDLSFYDDLSRRFGAPGDFAQAYVIAHEVGHHVQNLLGSSERVRAMQAGMSESEANELSVRLELQADFFAGVWAHHAQRARRLLEEGDVEEGLRAAAAIGDDRLQLRSRGYVTPDAFTHGTSEQRVRWFRRGLETGDPAQGDTFSAGDP